MLLLFGRRDQAPPVDIEVAQSPRPVRSGESEPEAQTRAPIPQTHTQGRSAVVHSGRVTPIAFNS